jgi:hypothetical protein
VAAPAGVCWWHRSCRALSRVSACQPVTNQVTALPGLAAALVFMTADGVAGTCAPGRAPCVASDAVLRVRPTAMQGANTGGAGGTTSNPDPIAWLAARKKLEWQPRKVVITGFPGIPPEVAAAATEAHRCRAIANATISRIRGDRQDPCPTLPASGLLLNTTRAG